MAGYTVIHSSYWKEYSEINKEDFVKKVYASVDALFLFVDFGISHAMLNIVEACYHREAETRFDKELIIDIALYGRSAGLGSILIEVASVMQVSIELLKSKTRERDIAVARQIYFKRAKLFTKASLSKIGAMVNRDHATVIHGINVVDECPTVRDRYEELFEGKKKERKLSKPSTTDNITIQDKAILIGRSAVSTKVINMTSPFTNKDPSNNRPYSGYRVHSF